MTIFLILAPYGAFATLMLLTSATLSLAGATAVCLAVIALDALRGRSIKILGAGSAVTFTAIALYLIAVDPSLSKSEVKLAVDIGIFLISLGSILVRHPFTSQYAIEAVRPEVAATPDFKRVNYIIAGAWTLAALMMMLGNLATVYIPGMPVWFSLSVALAARYSAVFFTKWYPAWRRIKTGRPSANTLSQAH